MRRGKRRSSARKRSRSLRRSGNRHTSKDMRKKGSAAMKPSKKEAMHAGKTKHAFIAYALVSAVFALLIGQPSRSAAAEVAVTEEAFVQMFEYDNWDNEIQIRKYVGKDTDVVIPPLSANTPLRRFRWRRSLFAIRCARSSCPTA